MRHDMPAVMGLLLMATTWTATPAELMAGSSGTATVLDARGVLDYWRGHVPGAVPIRWWAYRDGWLRTGRLPGDLDRLAGQLAALGVDDRRPVVVYGRAREGWGEEGRIAWMLHYLGHPDVRVLDGGFRAWVAAGGTVSRAVARRLPGAFSARPRAGVRATADDVARAARGEGAVLDVRSVREWNGATPYFESRAGHVPGAVHLEWTELLDAEGRVDRSGRALARLAALGVTPDRPVVVYCTGGVRSSQAFVALKALGFADVRNYDGSWWEWSADRSRPVAR
jgi:thiosulfate/3-mercaptopyruvate sulfurtransferase